MAQVTGTAPVGISARINGPITENNYCLGFVIVWPDGSEASNIFDCPPLAEYNQQWDQFEACMVQNPRGVTRCKVPYRLDRSFSSIRRFFPGQYAIKTKFVRSRSDKQGDYQTIASATARFTVVGGGEG